MERPFVYLNMAMTADGKITSARREYPRFTSDEDRRTMDRLRADADAVLVGAGTVRADDPPMQIRDPALVAARRSRGRPAGVLNVVVSARLDLDPAARFFTAPHDGGRIVATIDDPPAERLPALESVAEVWRCGEGRVALPRLLTRLRERGVERLLVEGGGETNWEFLREDLLDELYVTIAPTLLGGRDAPTWLEGDGLAMAGARRLRLVGVRRAGEELFCRWAVVR